MRCIPLSNQLEGHWQVALPISTDGIQFGYQEQESLIQDRSDTLKILQSSTRLASLAAEYTRSFISTPDPTIAQFSDLIQGLLLQAVNRSVQSRDVTYLSLGGHSHWFWSQPDATDFWDLPRPGFQKEGFFGPIGSIAYQNAIQSEPIPYRSATQFAKELSESTLKSKLGLSSLAGQTPKSLLERLLSILELDLVAWREYEVAIEKLLPLGASDVPVQLLPALRKVRQYLIDSNDFFLLRERWLLGEIHPDLLDTLFTLQQIVQESPVAASWLKINGGTGSVSLEQLKNRAFALGPGGAPLVIKAIALRALASVGDLLVSLPAPDRQIIYGQWILGTSHPELRLQVAKHFATLYDAYAILGRFGTLQEAKGISYRYFLNSAQMIFKLGLTIPNTDDSRLPLFPSESRIPIGCTPVQVPFIPFQQPSSVSGLPSQNTLASLVALPELSLDVEIIPTERIPETIVVGDYRVTVRVSPPYFEPGTNVEILVIVQDSSGATIPSTVVQLVASYWPSGRSLDQWTVRTDQNGQVVLRWKTPESLEAFQTIRIQASSSTTTAGTADSFTLVVPRESRQETQEQTEVPGVTAIPLQEAGVVGSFNSFEASFLHQLFNALQMFMSPSGSSGEGIYQDTNQATPNQAGLIDRLPDDAVTAIQGTTDSLAKSLAEWAKGLAEVHGKQPNSEVGVLEECGSDLIKPPVRQYKTLLEQAGQHAAQAMNSLVPDYANGNTYQRSNAREQFGVDQFRVEAGSLISLRGPFIGSVFTQAVHRGKYYHALVDILQTSAQYIFSRAEALLVLMAKTQVLWAEDVLDLNAGILQLVGKATNIYGNEIWLQAGQKSQTSQGAGEGGGGTVNQPQSTGNLVFAALKDLTLYSETGNIAISSKKRVSVRAQTQLAMQGLQVNLRGTQAVNIDGPIVSINGGRASNLPPVPIILRSYKVGCPARVYPKRAGRGNRAKPKNQIQPLTPEPTLPTAGPNNLKEPSP